MKAIKTISMGVLALSLGACSTITTGTKQNMTVFTEQVDGAKCTLVDSKKAHWGVSSTPGTVEVTKGDGPMKVTCDKAGYKTTSIIVEEGFAGMTLGNVILGGGVGIIVDAASGAAQKYPDNVYVWLEPENWSSPDEQQAWEAAKAQYDAEQLEKKKPVQAENKDESGNN